MTTAGLATRCTACGTVFRVVQDQLRVSEGWVRCGRCAEVFNATDALLDIESGSPAGAADEPAARLGDRPTQAEPAAPQTPLANVEALASQMAQMAQAPQAPQPAQPPLTPLVPLVPLVPQPPQTPPTRGTPPSDFSAFDTPAADAGADAAGTTTAEPMPAPAVAKRAKAPPSPPAQVGPTPSFVRRADQAQRWRQPRVRGALMGLAVLAALGLLAQMGLEYRELVAARFAATRPVLEQACELLGCSVGAARVIDSLAVESSGLVRVEKSSIYRLNVALRNRSSIAVALPALDLTLTDNQGKLLARRVLRAAELGTRETTLAAGSDLALQGTLQVDTDAIAGYTVEVFYP